MLNRIIDTYEILEEAGRGNAATVYVARQQPVGRYVALKVFDTLLPDSLARLQDLFDRTQLLDHVNILPIYDRGKMGDRAYWAMRYMPAGTLAARLRSQRSTPEEIDRFIAQIAAALDYAHQHGVIHGDLKPSNVLLDHPGNAFVSDFGLTAIVGVSPSGYQSPHRSSAPPDIRSDVYSLGAILYELLTGRLPIELHAQSAAERTNGSHSYYNRRIDTPLAPSSINARLTPEIDRVVMRALALDPDQRYQTPGELAAAYAQARATTAEPASAGVALIDRAEPVPSNRRAGSRRPVMWLVGLLGIAIIASAIALLSSRSPAAIPLPTGIPSPTATVRPADSPTPSTAPANAPTATASPTESGALLVPTSTASPAATATRTAPTGTRVFLVTTTPTISIEPLTLLIPRQENRTSLALSFSTHVRPDDAGLIGTLSMSVPPIESRVVERDLFRVGSGEQFMRVSITINCAGVSAPITTDEIVLIVQDDQGRTLLSQTVPYVKTWCQ